ncbi:TIM-barrel domain-containing protein [Catenovulum sediminis]|uniref:glycoside hydrolase family 31 protein n=1 Tax=Catenovulum sediminis TaxID=1740262 RepID=UPI00117C5A85|nr:TIM-barrel domain-containing protein [Catenovulum sediminis]
MRFLILLSLVFCTLSAQCKEYLQHIVNDQGLTVVTDEGQFQLSFINPSVVEVVWLAPSADKPSFSLPDNLQKSPALLTETDNELLYKTADFNVRIQKSPFQLQYFYQDNLLVEEQNGFSAQENNFLLSFKLTDDEKLLGAGERVLGMDRRGHRLPLYNRAHYGYTTESEQMNYSLPAVLSSQKYILVYDNAAKGWIDLGKTDKNTLQFEAVGGRQAYYVVAGSTYPDIVKNYVAVTGTQPMLPRWSLGYLASRFGYHTQAEAEKTVSLFSKLDFPLDAIIFDLYWFGKDVQGHMGNLQWDLTAFPKPVEMINNFKQQGINTVLITEPFILTTSKRWQEAVDNNVLATNQQNQPYTFDFYFGNTGLIDVFDKNAEHWFWQIYKDLMKQGVAGWWGDLGEPEVHPADIRHARGSGDEVHNAYGHQWAKMLYQNQINDFPNKRPFILMRSGFAGSQRYGMIPWTGDVSRSWGGLKPQVELSLQMSIMGLAYTHSDLGGFAGDNWDPELYLRWLQYGVFQPIYRPHAQENVAPEPVFHSKKVQDIARRFVHLRYQLMPYNYTLMHENSTTGMPLMRPLFFAEQNAEQYLDVKDTYLWGDAFLVSPITEPDIRYKNVPVPAGVWFDYWSERKILGGKTQPIPVDIESIPLLVKAGSFVPMVEVVNNAANYSSDQLTLHYYHDISVKTASGYLYEDDGQNRLALQQGNYEKLNFSAQSDKRKLSISLKPEFGSAQYQAQTKARQLTLTVHNITHLPTRVLLNGEEMKPKQMLFHPETRLLQLIFTQRNNQQIEITF